MAENDSWEAEDFMPEEPVRKAGAVTATDRWEGEDEEDEVKDNWDDEEDAENKTEPQKVEPKPTEKKKLNEKIKEKEKQLKMKQEELKKRIEEPEAELVELPPEEQLAEKLRLIKLQEDSDLELVKEAFGEVNVTGIDAMNPSSRDDFTEFGKLLKEKITLYEKSLYYPAFLEALLRDICISLEVDDLKKVSNALNVLCSEKQKQEKQNKAKKKKKGVVPGGGLKANMKNDLADYGGVDDGYREFEDFM